MSELPNWLHRAGCIRSTQALVEQARAQSAVKYLRCKTAPALQSDVHAILLAWQPYAERWVGIVAPLRVRPGKWMPEDPETRRALEQAERSCRAVFRCVLDSMQFEMLPELKLRGDSLALPALLSMLAHYASRAPGRPVFATGAIASNGAILPVGGMQLKLQIAVAERGGTDTLILVPRGANPDGLAGVEEVGTVDEAISMVFGPEPLALKETVRDLYDRLQEVHCAPSWPRALELLEAVDPERLREADRARLFFEMGAVLRHLGRSYEADALHEKADRLLGPNRRVMGELAVQYALQSRLSALDRFQLDQVIAWLREQPFATFSVWDELRYQGALAQALAMRGDVAEAVSVRSRNLSLHPLSEELAKGEAGTLCPLTLDLALCKNREGFEYHAARLFAVTRPGDARQHRYNAAAVVRGWVAFGDYMRALDWIFGQSSEYGRKASDAVRQIVCSVDPIDQHPEVSLARAVCRAMHKVGRKRSACLLAERAGQPEVRPGDLVGWLCDLLRLEGTLAETMPEHKRAEIRRTMMARHRQASAFHPRLLVASGTELESTITAVWY